MAEGVPAPQGFVQDAESSDIQISAAPEDGIGLATAGGPIAVSLPNADSLESASKLADGTIVYPSREGVADAVVPLEDGAQVLVTIANSDAPTEFRSDLTLSDGQRLVEGSDGGVAVLGADGDPVLVLAVPWAKDATGRSVPTHYGIVGESVVQVVDHTTTAGVTYPVVADPTYFYWWGGKESFSSLQATKATVLAAVLALVPQATGPSVITGAAVQWCNARGKGIWVYWTWAGHVWCTSR